MPRVRQVLVTGASGFLGRHLLGRLQAQPVRIRALTRDVNALKGIENVEIIRGDIQDQVSLPRALKDVDVVFHLAAIKQNPAHLWAVNVLGTRNMLLAAAAEKVIRFVHISSVGVIGADPLRRFIFDENAPCSPRNKYERSKWKSEELVWEAGAKGLRVTILRPANVFGAHDPETGLLRLARVIRDGKFFYLGSRNAICNYVFVEDVAHACLAVAEHPSAAGHTYHLSDSCTLGEFVDTLADELQVKRPSLEFPDWLASLIRMILRGRRRLSLLSNSPFFARLVSLNNQASFATMRLANELGFTYPVGWREGLKRLIKWYRIKGEI